MQINNYLTSEAAIMAFIFFARITDVSLGTIRIILISRGYRYLAPLFGFVEVIIWLFAISQAMKNLNSSYSYLIYGAGFAAGNYMGMLIESKIAIGYQAVRIITSEKLLALPLVLRQEGYGVTSAKGIGAHGEVTIIFSLIPRKKIPHVLKIVQMFEPNAFITIEDIKSHRKGFFGTKKSFLKSFGKDITKMK